jgi:hypothetical protein
MLFSCCFMQAARTRTTTIWVWWGRRQTMPKQSSYAKSARRLVGVPYRTVGLGPQHKIQSDGRTGCVWLPVMYRYEAVGGCGRFMCMINWLEWMVGSCGWLVCVCLIDCCACGRRQLLIDCAIVWLIAARDCWCWFVCDQLIGCGWFVSVITGSGLQEVVV